MMCFSYRLALFCICSIPASVMGQTTKPRDLNAEAREREQVPDPAKGSRWQDLAASGGWSQAEIAALDRDKLCFGKKEFRQVFDPYVGCGKPLFITSDSLLNAYHVLFEESVRRIESTNAGKLQGILKDSWTSLATVDSQIIGNPAQAASAKLRARITIAVALTLLGDDSVKPDAAIQNVVANEVKKVQAGVAADQSTWLGDGSGDGAVVRLDYARFMPRGFYTRSRRLKAYFRCVAWLQAVPFRVQDDTEFLSAIMISKASIGSRDRVRELARSYADLLGSRDNPDLDLMQDSLELRDLKIDLSQPKALDEVRRRLLANMRDDREQINDQLLARPDNAVRFHVLSARRTPDAVRFQRLTEKSDRDFPTGMEIAAALGSTYAIKHLPPDDGELARKAFPRDRTLYGDYLHAMEALLEQPEKDAPRVFSSELWQARSCQTSLAGWAQLRHTWQLQAKENVEYLGSTDQPAGFVEPAPEFYSRMALLCERAKRSFHTENNGLDFSQLSEDGHDLIELLEMTEPGPDGKPAPRSLTSLEKWRFRPLLDAAGQLSDSSFIMGDEAHALPAIKKLLADLDLGRAPEDVKAAEALRSTSESNINRQWFNLETICRRLDTLSNKQLRGKDFNEDENQFIKNYGADIAGVMLYGGNSYEVPRDDAPRVADVFQNPKSEKFLEVGIGRPRALYILYPWHGGEVLCEGAVLPYYEFTSGKTMTDEDWRAMLSSKNAPLPFISVTRP